MKINGLTSPSPGRGLPGPPPGARPGGGARGRAPGGQAYTHGARPGTAQNDDVGPPPASSPPAGGAKGVGCNVSWAAAEGGDLGEASSRDAERHLSGGEGA